MNFNKVETDVSNFKIKVLSGKNHMGTGKKRNMYF